MFGQSLQPHSLSGAFSVPADLEASEPPEHRGLSRDGVRLMITRGDTERIEHTRFSSLPEHLRAGDVLVLNASDTLKASVPAWRDDGRPLRLHLSTRLPADLHIVELRTPAGAGTTPFFEGRQGERLTLPEGAHALLLTPHRSDARGQSGAGVRLWIASVSLPEPLTAYLERHGDPIRYPYARQPWPIEAYRTVYATEAGSAEMPSAGRAFTKPLLARLRAKGVKLVSVILHTGVSSLEDREPPCEEFYRVPSDTADAVNEARALGHRAIAVGTTTLRALETVTGEDGITHPGQGLTDLVITPRRGVRAVTGMLTGLHEPRASHLAMLEALAGPAHLTRAYEAALRERYLWHEFGDLHLLLRPDS